MIQIWKKMSPLSVRISLMIVIIKAQFQNMINTSYYCNPIIIHLSQPSTFLWTFTPHPLTPYKICKFHMLQTLACTACKIYVQCHTYTSTCSLFPYNRDCWICSPVLSGICRKSAIFGNFKNTKVVTKE